jgi:toxin ParE1/3/4
LTIRTSKDAAEDLASATRYLAERNPRAATELVAEVLDLLERLDEGIFEGPEQQLQGGMLVRSWPLPPYRIYYRRRGGVLEVMRVYHQARRPITR